MGRAGGAAGSASPGSPAGAPLTSAADEDSPVGDAGGTILGDGVRVSAGVSEAGASPGGVIAGSSAA
jgi:hypothetical protein